MQIFRDRGMLVVIFVMPLIELVVLAYAATFELQDTPFHLVDYDQSAVSRQLVRDFEATGYFTLVGRSFDIEEGINQILSNEAKMVMVIPPNFSEALHSPQQANVQIIINAVNNSTAGLIKGYSYAILRQFSRGVLMKAQRALPTGQLQRIKVTSRNWYNQTLDYTNYMVPGIIVLLTTLICLILSVLNIVREEELGTIEQLNVTPIKRYQFIAGKLIPTWIIAMTVFSFSLAVAYFWFGVPFRGNILLLYLTTVVYLLVIQGIGLIVSTRANTQQQAMLINFFLIMVFIMMGGIFTPIVSMPEWAQTVAHANPITYFAEITRMILLKGSGWVDIDWMLGVLGLMAAVLVPFAILTYRKRTV